MNRKKKILIITGILLLSSAAIVLVTPNTNLFVANTSVEKPITPEHTNNLASYPYTREDQIICENKGYTPTSRTFKKCMIERASYKRCIQKNVQQIAFYSDASFCAKQAYMRFPQHLSKNTQKEYLVRYNPTEEYLIKISDRAEYSFDDLNSLHQDFTDLCQQEQQKLLASAEKTQPNCAYILNLSR